MVSLLKGLSEERTMLADSSQELRSLFPLDGVVRLMDKKGNTLGLIIGKETLDDINEDIEASNPAFWASLDASRKSGRVSGEKVRRRILGA